MRFLAFLLVSIVPLPASAQIIVGAATAVDGDSLEMAGTRIRLFGVDALEGRQTCQRNGATWACGQEAASQLAALIGPGPVSCEQKDRDRYGRTVAVCTAGRLDLGRTMVERGYAVALPQFSDAYVQAEERAQAAGYRRAIVRP